MVAEPTGLSVGPKPGEIGMNRTFLLVSGVFCWTVVAIDAAAHLIAGDLVAPAGMAIVFVLWVGLRRFQVRQRQRQTA